ncbi:hypothetical protein CUZ56_02686 [Saezia sanguinis]|uniref:Uncharacterized protein n=1 Tax=Saezia sanguinis TaxID=1965230 RepID=A0A433SAS6_9BURK|nr:hypothetical protein CUZ56_02686 [Saezia sanguinis]
MTPAVSLPPPRMLMVPSPPLPEPKMIFVLLFAVKPAPSIVRVPLPPSVPIEAEPLSKDRVDMPMFWLSMLLPWPSRLTTPSEPAPEPMFKPPLT